MMGNSFRKFAILTASIIVVGAALTILAARAEARDPRPGVALPENYMLGGEPGEDPHLKTIPTIYIVQETDRLGVAAADGSILLDECSMSAEGTREGCGRGLGSRVNRAWRVLLRTWLWHWHR